ncbi:heterokaryon incompatibility, partial [Immersiella caudata]
WGEERLTKNISIDGAPFPVLEALYPLIEAICDYECFRDDRWAWIDSICINQEDEHERPTVQLMDRVYQQLTRTTIWLGTGDANGDEALRFYHQLTDL